VGIFDEWVMEKKARRPSRSVYLPTEDALEAERNSFRFESYETRKLMADAAIPCAENTGQLQLDAAPRSAYAPEWRKSE